MSGDLTRGSDLLAFNFLVFFENDKFPVKAK